jgi:catechol 2,3-dioxygenase-like lactoylglutathione lyase family enzyme
MVRRLLISLCLACLPLAASAQPASGQGPLAGTPIMQVTLPVKDLDRSIAFYRDVLGVKLLARGKRAAMLDAGGFSLRLEQSDKAQPAEGVEIYFADPGLARFKPLTERGVKFVGPPETVNRRGDIDVKLAEFTDPDGNAIGIMGDVPRPGTR